MGSVVFTLSKFEHRFLHKPKEKCVKDLI